MIDRLFFSAVIVAACALTALVVSEAFVDAGRGNASATATQPVIELPRVVISAPRQPVLLPRVVITAPREPVTGLAADASQADPAPNRVQ